MPAEKALPSPVSTTTPTSSRNSTLSSTFIIWRLSAGLMQLRFSGRLYETHAMRFSITSETVSSSGRVVMGSALRDR
jgi:hypothetical protein